MKRFGIKSLLGLVAVVAVIISFQHFLFQPSEEELKSNGILVRYNSLGKLDSVYTTSWRIPEILFRCRPREVRFARDIVESELAPLPSMYWVEVVDVSRTKVSNDCIPILEQMKGLKKVICADSRIDAEGVDRLRKKFVVISDRIDLQR